MKINKLFYIICFATTAFLMSGCETTNLDQIDDPSGVPSSLLDPAFSFNYVQLKLPEFVSSANDFTQQVTRQMAMTGGNTYESAFQPTSFDTNWGIGYNILQTVKIMEPKCLLQGETYELGAAKVIRAYVLITMVDMYGDIPLTEALQGNANLAPRFDSSASVYKQVLLDIDEAIGLLSQTNTPQSKIQDLYYSSKDSWITLANTLKLKMYCTARLAGSDIGISDIGAAISGIINSGNYINDSSKDFAFQYGNSRFTPNTRHPMYNDQYELNGGAYIGNYMMWAMTTEKGDSPGSLSSVTGPVDPRVPFYFFKQDADPSNEDQFTLPKGTRPDHYNNSDYVSFYDPSVRAAYKVSNWVGGAMPANGFWGRDHGDNSGIPPDSDKRTVAGIYPIGGAYGNPTSVQTSGNKGLLGEGIMPILLSSYVHFMKAEAILTLGISGDAKAELELGVKESITKATSGITKYPGLTATQVSTIQAGVATKTTNYWNNIISPKYDSSDAAKKLELIIKEYYIAAWGNGIEPYNNYRRTGYPSNFQPTLEPISGQYYSTALYPAASAINNPNTPTNVRTKKVFWDKANVILH